MKRSTAVLLVAAALIAGAAFLLRPSPKPEAPRPRDPEPSTETPAGRPVPVARPRETGSTPPPAAAPTPTPTPGPAVAPAAGVVEIPKAGVIQGTVRVRAAPSRIRRIGTDTDPRCAALHAEPPPSEEIVVSPDLGLRWAFVYVKEGARPTPSPEVPVLLAQAGCLYRPHVLGVQVGQPLLIRNEDPLLHNIHVLPFANPAFNFGQPTAGLEQRRTFKSPEVMIKVVCDVHPWMRAWVGVLDHPYFAVTDAEGAYALPELPAGLYTVEAWHEAYRSVAELVELQPGAGAVVNFQLDDRQ